MSDLPRVVVTRALPGPALALLADLADVWVSPHDRPLTAAELQEAVVGATAVVSTLNDRMDDAALAAAGPSLRLVANTATGYDNIDLGAAAGHEVAVTNTPGVLVAATADLTMALVLDVTRRVSEGDRLIRSGTPWAWDIGFMLGSALQGKRLGVVGMGAIGRAVADRARAFGMDVVHHARSQPDIEGASRRVALDELLTTSDVVSLHCPLTSQTRHLIDAERLRRMKPTAFLVNTARGPVVDEGALVDALRDGTIAGAALDVYEDEPLVHPGLLGLDNVVLAPHLGSATTETRGAMADLAVRNVVELLAGREVLTPVLIASA
ncbi:D-glycerate dehydrogenase [Streptomyces sp. NPDC088124]|uniref:2-hydroxyacid dehydrogenase n=1 Tax=Streptomyces sp. NPDC088124 TaxID=3154654 RepID=UPI0034193610